MEMPGNLAGLQRVTASFVQSGSGTAATASFSANTTIGNCLVACVQGYGASSVSAVTTGSSGDHWTQLKAVSGASGQVCAIWIDPACTVSRSSVTFTASGGTQMNIQAYEFAGMGAAPVLDGAPASKVVTGVNSTSWTAGPAVSSSTADIWIGMYAGNNSGVLSASTSAAGWSDPEGSTNGGSGAGPYTSLVSAYQIPGTAGSFSLTGGVGTNRSVYGAIALAITPGTSGGGGSSAGSFLPFFP
jgi:hypothetical protein